MIDKKKELNGLSWSLKSDNEEIVILDIRLQSLIRNINEIELIFFHKNETNDLRPEILEYKDQLGNFFLELGKSILEI